MMKTRICAVLSLLLVACAPDTSTVGQHITCETDPNSGVVLSCQPGDGSGDADSCEDIDEDGDGQPGDDDGADHDAGDDNGDDSTGAVFATAPDDGSSGGSDDGTSSGDSDDDGVDDGQDDDDDNDGITDDQDCDEQEGEDGDESDLPYDVRLDKNASVTPIVDAFAERGAQPAEIVSVEMDGGGGAGWRLAELQAGATFTVTDADCSHAGNRDVGRDRVLVTWRTADGHVESDHLDLRYCGR